MNFLHSDSLVKGVNVISYFGKCFGLAQSARLIIASLQKQGIPFSLISADSMAEGHPAENFSLPISNQFTYPVNIFCLDQRQISSFIESQKWKDLKNAYNIAICFWETNQFPKEAKNWWYYLDEIWTTTHYVHEHLSIASALPVYRIPQPVSLPSISKDIEKGNFNLPPLFTFLFYFSFSSVINRKNPLAVIRAFQKAFQNDEKVQLVIKSQNGFLYPEQLKAVKEEIKEDARIIWLDQTLQPQECYDLMSVCDCYVSLHRSEGFGLTLAEAMLLEKPVIATGYSGNLDFMNADNSFLCSHRLISVGKGDIYPENGKWADPDIDHAAYLISEVFHHPEASLIKAKKGRDYISTHHSYEKVGQYMAWRLSKIYPSIQAKSMPWKYIKAKMAERPKRLWKKTKNQIKRLIGKGRKT